MDEIKGYMTTMALSAYHTRNSVPDFRRANTIRNGIRKFLTKAQERTRIINPQELNRLEDEIIKSGIDRNLGRITRIISGDYTDGTALYYEKVA